MLKGFEDLTSPLSDEERKLALIIIGAFRKGHIGKKNLINSHKILSGMKNAGHKLEAVRLRKIINRIRATAMAPICSNSKGYWYADNKQDILDEIKSLRQRIKGIDAAVNGLNEIVIQNYSTELFN